MRLNEKPLIVALLLAVFCSSIGAESLAEGNKLTVDSVNLRAEQFFKSYMSNDVRERENAELYLLGVMDATEGKSWCDYRTFKTITLRERILDDLKNWITAS